MAMGDRPSPIASPVPPIGGITGFQDLVNQLVALNKNVSLLITVMQSVFPLATGTAATATGGAATLPGNPVGFVEVFVPSLGITVKVPYYST